MACALPDPLTGPFPGVLERLRCLHRPSGRFRAERPFPGGLSLTSPLKSHGFSRRTETSGLGLRLAHKKGRDIFFKFGYAAGDEAYALH